MAMAGQRRGSDTKAEIRKVAIELFTAQGYEATSLREIAERLGITKAALYYHFSGKEDIVHSLFTEYRDALDSMVTWARQQPPGPDLHSRAVDRMVDLVTGDGLPAMRFALANPRIVRDIDTGRENAFERLTELFEVLSGPDASLEQELRPLRPAQRQHRAAGRPGPEGVRRTDRRGRSKHRPLARPSGRDAERRDSGRPRTRGMTGRAGGLLREGGVHARTAHHLADQRRRSAQL